MYVVVFSSSFQLLQAFQKHRDLIKRPTISKELKPERETLLTRLLDYNKGQITCTEQYNTGSLPT